jgi:hypothetical protein
MFRCLLDLSHIVMRRNIFVFYTVLQHIAVTTPVPQNRRSDSGNPYQWPTQIIVSPVRRQVVSTTRTATAQNKTTTLVNDWWSELEGSKFWWQWIICGRHRSGEHWWQIRKKWRSMVCTKNMRHICFRTEVSGYMYNDYEQLESTVDRFSLLVAMFVLSTLLARQNVHITIRDYHGHRWNVLFGQSYGQTAVRIASNLRLLSPSNVISYLTPLIRLQNQPRSLLL